jgi:hypothetical protein
MTTEQEVEPRLTSREVKLVRLALEELLSESTREQHIIPEIHRVLAKLPNPETT